MEFWIIKLILFNLFYYSNIWSIAFNIKKYNIKKMDIYATQEKKLNFKKGVKIQFKYFNSIKLFYNDSNKCDDSDKKT